jgi:multidrug efflux pump subunit AcrA (membrane-fusion protein)
MVAVRRDDLVQTRTVSCRSRPIREEIYSFQVGGIYIDQIYVSVGDHVAAGDMLAELERREILTQVEEARIEVQRQEFALELVVDDTALRRDAFLIQSAYEQTTDLTTAEGRVDAINFDELAAESEQFKKLYDDYLFRVSYAEKMLEIAERKLDALLAIAEERVIYTNIDGVISYALRVTSQSRSVANEKAFTVSDASELIYTVMGDDALLFESGEVYTMRISRSFLEMRAFSPEDMGEPPPRTPVMFFMPEDLVGGLATYGYITVEINRRDNVLYLPANAIIQIGDEYAVYRENAQGFRELSKIEIGETISGKTVILYGLSEGDEVILD